MARIRNFAGGVVGLLGEEGNRLRIVRPGRKAIIGRAVAEAGALAAIRTNNENVGLSAFLRDRLERNPPLARCVVVDLFLVHRDRDEFRCGRDHQRLVRNRLHG